MHNYGSPVKDVKAEVFILTEDINITYPDEGQIYGLGDFSVEDTKEFKFYFFTNRRYSTIDLPLYVNLTESKGEFDKTIDLDLQVTVVIDGSTLLRDGSRVYASYSDPPYSGIAVWYHENGQKRWERTYKDGKKDGLLN